MKRNQPPIGIIITMGKEVLEANGGANEWQKHFESCVKDENTGFWLHKSRNAPKEDIAIVYVIAENFVQWKVFYGGYERGATSVWMRDGEERVIDWPRMILAGPFEKAPQDIPMRGFQGFRYVYEPIF
jgi:hypothetical protein